MLILSYAQTPGSLPWQHSSAATLPNQCLSIFLCFQCARSQGLAPCKMARDCFICNTNIKEVGRLDTLIAACVDRDEDVFGWDLSTLDLIKESKHPVIYWISTG